MFPLPGGPPVSRKEDVTLGVTQFPFDYGAVTYTKDSGKTIVGQRIVADGRGVAALAQGDEETEYFAGERALRRLNYLAKGESIGSRAVTWTQEQTERVLQRLPEAIINRDMLKGLIVDAVAVDFGTVRDLSALVTELASRPAIQGALALENGILINSGGDIARDAEIEAAHLQSLLEALEASATEREQTTSPVIQMMEGDGRLTVARHDNAAIAIWTGPGMDAEAALRNAVDLVRRVPAPVEDLVTLEALPEGTMISDRKASVEGIIRQIEEAMEINLSGAIISVSPEDKRISLLLRGGRPIGMHGADNLEDGLQSMTAASHTLRLERIEAVPRLAVVAESTADWSLERFIETLPSTRTRRDDKAKLRRSKLEGLLGFDLGLAMLNRHRAQWSMSESVERPVLTPVGEEGEATQLGVPDAERARIAEGEVDDLERKLARNERRLEESSTSLSRVRVERDETSAELERVKERATGLEQEIEEKRSEMASARRSETDSQRRAERLTRRVAELEVAVGERAEELARALSGSDSLDDMRSVIERLAKDEAETKANLAQAEASLSETLIENEAAERMRQVLSEQTESARQRLRIASAELEEINARSEVARHELNNVEAELRAQRRREEEGRQTNKDLEVRQAHLQNELRELLEQRRVILREIGDLEARRSRERAELRSLVSQSEELTDAHEQAKQDLAEADRLRQRLMEEPLGQALLGGDQGFTELAPLLQRIEALDGRGYSILLLDRAVDRGLQIIQATVDEVAKTPRNLLAREVVDLLESQSPETASAVRGLTRWSVQQRLQNRLGECVQFVVLELEHMLEEFDQAITMLRRLNSVLTELSGLGGNQETLRPLEAAMHRPQALPVLARRIRTLVQEALDDIYIGVDQVDKGESALDDTVTALEGLIESMDATGLTGEDPPGRLWTFQRSGRLSFEALQLTERERPPLDLEDVASMRPMLDGEVDEWQSITVELGENEAAIYEEEMSEDNTNSNLEEEEKPITSEDTSPGSWDDLEPPSDTLGAAIERKGASETPVGSVASNDEMDELARLEAEIERLDRMATKRRSAEIALELEDHPSKMLDDDSDEAVEALERDLEGIDL